jgi:hypothetical protein
VCLDGDIKSGWKGAFRGTEITRTYKRISFEEEFKRLLAAYGIQEE